ncbi:hypothetical protein [Oceanobacillus salinisoli]|uniref:hypothetical protein n=1 Tax=Oceanobacillus salinisoli TaxID=2678611 RepID=UPI0012E219E3|nr:hypothetical protein [Oceanobacillus salinisoli]
MTGANYYHFCHKYTGRAVQIRDHYGNVYRGRIRYVTPRGVYLDYLKRPGGFFIPFFVIVSLVLLSTLFF